MFFRLLFRQHGFAETPFYLGSIFISDKRLHFISEQLGVKLKKISDALFFGTKKVSHFLFDFSLYLLRIFLWKFFGWRFGDNRSVEKKWKSW